MEIVVAELAKDKEGLEKQLAVLRALNRVTKLFSDPDFIAYSKRKYLK